MKLTKEDCILLLRRKQMEADRYPKKSDFSEEEVAMIKSFFGPWPRALEAAGVKEPREIDKKQKRQQKRIAAKRTRNERRKEIKKMNVAEKKGKVEE
ncbi:MAG: hypothetical protein K2L07_01935 [Lachnospiraceae bacterium]|nr:hypothetical protein [Lachnospiraceae bacterium]